MALCFLFTRKTINQQPDQQNALSCAISRSDSTQRTKRATWQQREDHNCHHREAYPGPQFRVVNSSESWSGTFIPAVRIQKFELLPAERLANLAFALAKLMRLAISLVVLYFYASLVLGFFPWTHGYAQTLIGYLLSPLKLVSDALVGYLPNVFFIGVIVLISLYVTKLSVLSSPRLANRT